MAFGPQINQVELNQLVYFERAGGLLIVGDVLFFQSITQDYAADRIGGRTFGLRRPKALGLWLSQV